MLPADVSRCPGTYCSGREHCLRYTTPPVPDHPNQARMDSPHTEDSEVSCGLFMFDLDPGQQAKFFHPGTMGVMRRGVVLEAIDQTLVKVRFDDLHPTNGRQVFNVPPQHIEA